MEAWQIELLKIGSTAIIAFLGGLISYWVYLHKRKIENAPVQEKLQEAEKLTSLFIQHQKHNISPFDLREFRERMLSSADLKPLRRILEECLLLEGY